MKGLPTEFRIAPGATRIGRTVTLFQSRDGVKWEAVTLLDVPDHPNETTLRFAAGGECLALVRREAGDRNGWLGRALPPYRDWKWESIGRPIGGPDMLLDSSGQIWIAGRDQGPDGPRTAIGPWREGAWRPRVTLPSGGDNSYPGMALRGGTLWIGYYSSHEGRAAIYLARIRGLMD